MLCFKVNFLILYLVKQPRAIFILTTRQDFFKTYADFKNCNHV